MKIGIRHFLHTMGGKYYSAAYKKGGKWRIYYCSTYDIKSKRQAEDLIKEVMGEMHVARKNVKLVHIESISCKEVKFDK